MFLYHELPPPTQSRSKLKKNHPRLKLIHHYDGNFQGFWYKKEIYNSHISYVSIEEKIPILRFDLYFQFLLYRQGWILYRVRLTVSTSGLSI